MKKVANLGLKTIYRRMLTGTQSDISGWTIVKFFVYSLALVAVSDVPNNWGIVYYGALGIVCLLLLAVVVLPFRSAVVLLVILATTGKDIVSSSNLDHFDMVYSTASIWQVQFGPIRPSWIVFACVFAKVAQFELITVTSPVKRAILWFATVPLVTGLLYGGFFTDHAVIEVVSDIRFPLMLLGSTILFQSAYRKDRRYFYMILSAFIGALLARHLVDLVYLLANFGPEIAEGISRASEDSAKGGIVFLFFFSVILIWLHKRLFLGVVIALPSIALLAAYGTRMLWVTFLLGVIVMLFVVSFRRAIFIISIVAILTIGGGWTLRNVFSESANIALLRLYTITKGIEIDEFSVPVDYNLISRVDQVRYAEFLNITDTSWNRFSWFWGSGYGGYYVDEVVRFPPELKSAFPDYSFLTGRFYWAHFFPLYIFHKQGLIGLIIISAVWIVPGFAAYRVFKKNKIRMVGQPSMPNVAILSLICFLPTAMFQLYWSGKGLFINGMIIASCMEFTRHHPGSFAARVCQRTGKMVLKGGSVL